MRFRLTILLVLIIGVVASWLLWMHPDQQSTEATIGRETAIIGPGSNYNITWDKRVGRYVVYENNGQIILWRRVGNVTGTQRLYAYGHNPQITPDAKYIVYDRDGYIYRNDRRIARGTNPTVTVSGVFIAFERDNHIMLWNGHTGNTSIESRLTNRTIISGANPQLSYHGNWLLFESDGNVIIRYLGPK